MDCNKDEALRAKEIAEKALLQKDFGKARVLAKKAQELYPNLDGLPQFTATIEVYISAEKTVNGEVDWYGVLGVQPLANTETIRRRYRKLALTLHPDKNKSVGADGAFHLISQAWSLLSDKAKRITYDKKRNLWGMPASQSGVSNNVFNPVILKQTFWTICRSCGTNFEFHTVHINSKLVCTCCSKPFLASETSPPRIPQMRQHNFNTTQMERSYHVLGRAPMSAVNSSLGSGSFSMPDDISRVPTSASSAAEGPGVFRMSTENLRRGHEDSTPVLKKDAHFGKTHAVERTGAGSAFQPSHFGSNSILKEHRPRKKKPTDEHKVGCDGSGMETKASTQNEGIKLANELSQKCSFDSRRANAAGNYKRSGFKEMPQSQSRIILMEMAKGVIKKKLDEWSKPKNISDTEIREKGKERVVNSSKHGAQEFVDSGTVTKKCVAAAPVPELPSLAMNVPDPDFHDFDGERTENAFAENQVWAVYDDEDGMPRYFCLIHDVVSKNPFNMRISWLNAKRNDEWAPINWVISGFTKPSGDFSIGKKVYYNTLNSFSHRVEWTKGPRGVVHIYLKKGDIWALYRNWSLDWNRDIKDESLRKYDMVEVLGDCSEEGVSVAPLVKVAGFKTVFRRNVDPTKVKNIAKAEMFRFSHKVPSYLLTGEEGQNAPKGCLELDPAALPMELLQVLAEDLEPELVMTTEKPVEDELKQKENSKEDGSVEKCQTTKEEEGSEGLGEKPQKPEILYVYKRRRLGGKKEKKSGK